MPHSTHDLHKKIVILMSSLILPLPKFLSYFSFCKTPRNQPDPLFINSNQPNKKPSQCRSNMLYKMSLESTLSFIFGVEKWFLSLFWQNCSDQIHSGFCSDCRFNKSCKFSKHEGNLSTCFFSIFPKLQEIGSIQTFRQICLPVLLNKIRALCCKVG